MLKGIIPALQQGQGMIVIELGFTIFLQIHQGHCYILKVITPKSRVFDALGHWNDSIDKHLYIFVCFAFALQKCPVASPQAGSVTCRGNFVFRRNISFEEGFGLHIELLCLFRVNVKLNSAAIEMEQSLVIIRIRFVAQQLFALGYVTQCFLCIVVRPEET
ncbi:hypothetical protein D3C86_1672610 [compost metagenome]